jgi:cyclopropane fatty-acyl-phospholipid synthase-like methyltransferase
MTWDEQWTDEKTIRKWLKPDQKIVELARDLKSRGCKRAFDLGCGVGRHVIFLAKEGYEVYASDFSEPAIKYCQEWLSREGLSATVTKMDMTGISYPNGFFDLIIAYNVIYHTTLTGMIHLIRLIHGKLRSGGYFLVTLKSTEEWIYGQGEEIEKNTFFRPGKGVPIHFSTEEEIGILFKDFALVSKEYLNYVKETTQKRHAFWEIVLRKPDELS